MGKKVTQAYVLENLEYLAKSLVHIRDSRNKGGYIAINLEGLQKAIMALPRKDRENIERFWGLKGGINHSKKLMSLTSKDIAFVRMSNEAIMSLRSLFRLDFLYMYDNNVIAMINCLGKKINKKGMEVSDLEAIKYLVAFLVILQNGPKMSFEEELMTIDRETNPEYSFDEYTIINETYKKLRNIPEESINLRLIHDLLDMIDLKDALAIKKSFCIEIPKEYSDLKIEGLYTFAQIRSFKERIFPYGCWNVSEELILGDAKAIVKLEGFMKCLDAIRKDWSKVVDFKVGHRQLRTSQEIRTLDVYDIGGLEFNDIYEIMFLYLERNIIAPEN